MFRVLIINEVSPSIKNRTSIIWEKVMPILSKKHEIKIFWLSCDYSSREKESESWYELLHISDFKNAREVIQKTNPSVIYLMPGISIVDYSFLITARLLNIATFGWVDGAPVFSHNTSRKKVFLELARQFFERKQIKSGNNKFRGLNYIKKNLFFIRSARAMEKNYDYIISELLEQFNSMLFFKRESGKKIHARYNTDLLLVENEPTIEYESNLGLLKSNMKLVGDPTYDFAFQESRNKIISYPKNKLQVLFITVNFTSGQGESDWTPTKQKKMISELVQEYEKLKDEIDLKIKIHPISENYSSYKKILEYYKSDIQIYQTEDIYELIKNVDVILTTSSSTAGLISIIMQKPIVVWNYFHVKEDIFIKNELVIHCENASEIKECLINGIKFSQENRVKINQFIEKYCGDGNASEKIANEVERLLLEHN